MTDRPLLDADHTSEAARAHMAGFHQQTLAEVRAAVAAHPIVVVGMAQNPFVKKARKALTAAGIDFHYLEYGSYFSQWKPRLAIKLWSGYPTFPQVFVRGRLIGGFNDVVNGIADGSIVKMRDRVA